MAVENIQEKLAQMLSPEKSGWLEDANFRTENRGWLKRSQTIAMKVLDRLEELNWDQKKLADKMNVTAQQVSKIVKGNENLTLKSIDNLERALGIELVRLSMTRIIISHNTSLPKEGLKRSPAIKLSMKLKQPEIVYEASEDKEMTYLNTG